MRTLLRFFMMILVVAVVGLLILNFWPGGFGRVNDSASPSIGTDGAIDTTKVRERAADIGEKAAVATQKLQETVSEAALTTKIKAKMALDDSLKSRTIDVSTNRSTVTVSGDVPSAAARARALALARETDGVSVVIDHLEVAGR